MPSFLDVEMPIAELEGKTGQLRHLQDGSAPNFGMDRPEGYRKAMRLMRLAERNRLPIVTLVDTSGAYAIAPAKSASGTIALGIGEICGLACQIRRPPRTFPSGAAQWSRRSAPQP